MLLYTFENKKHKTTCASNFTTISGNKNAQIVTIMQSSGLHCNKYTQLIKCRLIKQDYKRNTNKYMQRKITRVVAVFYNTSIITYYCI